MSYRETMTPRRSRQLAALAALLLVAGCSGNKFPTPQTSTPPDTASTQTSTASAGATAVPPDSPGRPTGPPPPGPGQLDGGSCLKLTGATLNLMSGSNADDNRKAADTIEGFNPPDDVRGAVEHFVSTGGLQQSDPKKNEYSRTVNNWVEKVCPV